MGTFLIFRKPGPAWVPGKGSREQPGWDEHARFMDALHVDGKILLGGPYDDYSRVLQIVLCATHEEAERIFDNDPWTRTGILVQDGVHAWSAWLRPSDWPVP